MTSSVNFVNTPNNGTPVTLTAANISTDGTGATGRGLLATGAVNGSKFPAFLIEHLGSNVATLLRFFWNNGSDPEVASNNALIGEVPVAANTLSQTAASIPYVAALNRNLKNGEKIYVCLATAVAAGVKITPMGGGDF